MCYISPLLLAFFSCSLVTDTSVATFIRARFTRKKYWYYVRNWDFVTWLNLRPNQTCFFSYHVHCRRQHGQWEVVRRIMAGSLWDFDHRVQAPTNGLPSKSPLLACSSHDLWVLSKGPEAYFTLEECHAVDWHPLKKVWENTFGRKMGAYNMGILLPLNSNNLDTKAWH